MGADSVFDMRQESSEPSVVCPVADIGVVPREQRGSLGEVRASVAATVALLAGAPSLLWQSCGTELAQLLAEVDQLAALAAGLRVAVTAEAVDRGDVASSQCANTATWVAQHAPSLANGPGAGQVAKLVEQTLRKPSLAPVLDAVVAGKLPVAVAQVVLSEFDKLRKRVVPDALELVLEGLVHIGVAEGARQVRRLRPALLAKYGLADELQRDQDRAARLVALSYGMCTEDGMWEYRFTVGPEGKAVLEAAIGMLSAPWHPDGARDSRSPQQRRAQALIEVCRRVNAAAKAAGPFGGYPTTERAGEDTAGSPGPSDGSAGSSAGTRQSPVDDSSPADVQARAAEAPQPEWAGVNEVNGARVDPPANSSGTGSGEPEPPGSDPVASNAPHRKAFGADRMGEPSSQSPEGQPPSYGVGLPRDCLGNDAQSNGPPGADPPGNGPPGNRPPGADPPRGGATGAGPPTARSSSAGPPGADSGECDAAMIQAALAGLGAGGTKATLLVTMELGDLQERVGAGTVLGTVEDGALLAPETVRRAACDARVVPVVLGSRGEVLELGRAERLFTPAQARAVLLRDRHCTFPRCDAPAFWCDLHHVWHWADGGPTDRSNAAMLCGRHHAIVHRDRLIATVTLTGVRWDTTAGSYDAALDRLTRCSA